MIRRRRLYSQEATALAIEATEGTERKMRKAIVP
jgi:hypothetical protein